MKKKYGIGKYLTFKFSGRKFDLSGVVLDYNDTYTLIRNMIDYSPDGFIIFKNEKVEHHTGEHEKTATRILKCKNYSFTVEPVIPIDSLHNIFTFLNDNYQLIQLDNRKGDECDIVRYSGKDGDRYFFDSLTPAAKWGNKLKLSEKECRFICFDNNYTNSLKLITKF